MAEQTGTESTGNGHQATSADMLRELVAHLRAGRTQLRQEWARRIGEAGVLTALTQGEIFSRGTSGYGNYGEGLGTRPGAAPQGLPRQPSERTPPPRGETDTGRGLVLP